MLAAYHNNQLNSTQPKSKRPKIITPRKIEGPTINKQIQHYLGFHIFFLGKAFAEANQPSTLEHVSKYAGLGIMVQPPKMHGTMANITP